MEMRPSSAIRAAGAAIAAASAGRAPTPLRALLLGGSDVVARRIDPVGLQPLAINPSGDLNVLVSVKPDVVTSATGAAAWTALNLGVHALLRRIGIPAVLRGVAVGSLVYVADVTVSARFRHVADAESVSAELA